MAKALEAYLSTNARYPMMCGQVTRLLFLTLLLSTCVFSEVKSFSFMYGLGVSNEGPSGNITGEVVYGKYLYGLTLIGGGGLCGFGVCDKPIEEVLILGPLFGKALCYRFAYLSVTAGPAYLRFIRKGAFLYTERDTAEKFIMSGDDVYERKIFNRMGLHLQTDLVVKLWYIGIGVQPSVTFNTFDTFYKLNVVLYGGK